MKVSGAGGPKSTGAVLGGAKPASGGAKFSLPGVEAAAGPGEVARATAASGVGSVDALLALQAAGGPLERRKRAVNRAGRILDVLDEVKIALIDGDLSPTQLDKLARAVRQQRDMVDDPQLEALLDQIETRAAVEMAKFEAARRAVTRQDGA